MKVENGEKSMKTTILWKSALVVSALLVFLFTILGEAAPMGEAGPLVTTPPLKATTPPLKATTSPLKVTFRPLSEFLDAQGTTSPLFFPPVQNYVGWVDGDRTTFALVDYAGLANDYLRKRHVNLGTRVHGFVTQRELASGRAEIAVALFTTNALGFAQSYPDILSNDTQYPFLNTPTIFGKKAQDVANDKEAAVGQSIFLITFFISEPGAPLPDLVDVVDVDHHPEFSPVDINFTATIPGKCKHGTRAVLHVDQTGPVGCEPSPGCKEVVRIDPEPCH
jgi:hypothetical protein